VNWLGLVVMALFALPVRAEPMLENITGAQADAWNTVCAHTGYDCSFVPPPQVWYMEMPEGVYGAYQYFPTQPGIEVNVKLVGTVFSKAVMIHEMTHYLQHFHNPRMPRCQREAEAFNLMYLITDLYNYHDPRIVPWIAARYKYECWL